MRRRGVILPAVLVTLTVGAFIGTTALFFADAGRRAAAAGLEQGQVRALGWSGVQAAMSELASQRDALIGGAAPELTAEWMAFETSGVGGGRTGLFRLTPIGPQGALAVSENGKLNLNVAPEASIARLPGLDAQLASAIVRARPLESLEDLLAIDGISWEMVYGGGGGADEVAAGAFAGEGRDQDGAVGAGVAGGFAGGGALALADTATVYSFDPNIQSGIDDDQLRGERRLNLNVTYNDRLGEALDRRFGQGAGEAVGRIMESGRSFERDADFVEVLRLFQLPADQWAPVLDGLTTSGDEFVGGRVDLNVAEAATLAALPGFDDEIAGWIVDRRETMSPSVRQSVSWPVSEGLLTEDQFEEAVDHLTTRSMQWRVRIEAGLTARGQTGIVGGVDVLSFDEFGVLDVDDSTHLERRVVLEAVIDVASQRPRVAFLRDVTHEALSRRLAVAGDDAGGRGADRRGGDVMEDDRRSEHLGDLDMGGVGAGAGGAAARGGRAVGGGAMGDEGMGGGMGAVMDGGGMDGAGGDGAGRDGVDGAPGEEPAAGDPRRGRWTAGGGR